MGFFEFTISEYFSLKVDVSLLLSNDKLRVKILIQIKATSISKSK